MITGSVRRQRDGSAAETVPFPRVRARVNSPERRATAETAAGLDGVALVWSWYRARWRTYWPT
jgi:hypothetical protein